MVVENQLPVMRVNTEVPHSPTALKDAIKQLKWKEIHRPGKPYTFFQT